MRLLYQSRVYYPHYERWKLCLSLITLASIHIWTIRIRALRCAARSLSDASVRVVRALEDAGLEAWFVGGWVRDALLGAPSHDVDLCCSGTWQQSEDALLSAGVDVVRSGIRFGGITAIADGERIEVTAYRKDGFYTDGRRSGRCRYGVFNPG